MSAWGRGLHAAGSSLHNTNARRFKAVIYLLFLLASDPDASPLRFRSLYNGPCETRARAPAVMCARTRLTLAFNRRWRSYSPKRRWRRRTGRTWDKRRSISDSIGCLRSPPSSGSGSNCPRLHPAWMLTTLPRCEGRPTWRRVTMDARARAAARKRPENCSERDSDASKRFSGL